VVHTYIRCTCSLLLSSYPSAPYTGSTPNTHNAVALRERCTHTQVMCISCLIHYSPLSSAALLYTCPPIQLVAAPTPHLSTSSRGGCQPPHTLILVPIHTYMGHLLIPVWCMLCVVYSPNTHILLIQASTHLCPCALHTSWWP